MRIGTCFESTAAPRRAFALGAALAAMCAAGAARAQLPMPGSTNFDITGFIEEATLDPSCTASPHCGGTIKVDGHLITVPKEIVIQFPAQSATWQEMFSQAPAPYGLTAAGGPESGLAMADLPTPLTQYEAHVVGNRVLGGPAGADLYIAALLFM